MRQNLNKKKSPGFNATVGGKKMKKYTMETTVGIFLVVGLLCVGYLTVKLGHVSLLGDNAYSLFARFTSVTGLRAGSLVYISGIHVGRVEKLTMDQESQKAVVEIRVQNDIKIYDDAIASIKTEGLLGDMHLSIDPGGAGALLKPGGTITETQPAVDIADLISKYAFGDVKKP
jgi:phospholipid/cholesterol/gamma-HCH transport system substrate-binding protein